MALHEAKLKITDNASIVGPDGAVYSAYIFVDAAYDSLLYGLPEYADTDSCRLVLYRWDGTKNQLVMDKAKPKPQPVVCRLENWDEASENRISAEDFELLQMSGYKSDINQNGLPELAVYEWWCPNACDDTTGFKYRFYEIRAATQIIEITSNVPGTITPWKFVHSQKPLTIYVSDPITYELHTYIEIDRIFEWNGTQYVDVSPRYADEYRAAASATVESLEARYGQPLKNYDLRFLQILVTYERAGLPLDEGLNLFIDVTDLAHWPGTDSEIACWLQIARAHVQQQFSQTGHYSLPPSPTYLSLGPDSQLLVLQSIDQSAYDLSACR